MRGSELHKLVNRSLVWPATRSPVSLLPEVCDDALPTGHESLDGVLGGGWPAGTLTELLIDGSGYGEVGLLMPALADLLSRDGETGNRWIIWVGPPYVPYAPALAGAGLDLDRVFIVRATAPDDIVWVTEQAVHSDVCAAVLAWPEESGSYAVSRSMRRLQVAASGSSCRVFVYRHIRHARDASPAPLRIGVTPARAGLRLDVMKRRGGGPVSLVVPHALNRTGPEY